MHPTAHAQALRSRRWPPRTPGRTPNPNPARVVATKGARDSRAAARGSGCPTDSADTPSKPEPVRRELRPTPNAPRSSSLPQCPRATGRRGGSARHDACSARKETACSPATVGRWQPPTGAGLAELDPDGSALDVPLLPLLFHPGGATDGLGWQVLPKGPRVGPLHEGRPHPQSAESYSCWGSAVLPAAGHR